MELNVAMARCLGRCITNIKVPCPIPLGDSAFYDNPLCQYLSFLNISLNWLGQYLSFINTVFNRFYSMEKFGVTPHCLYRDWLTLKLKFNLSKLNIYP